ncbi:MAG: hypothetical protein C4563_06625 [Desulfobulbus sp.]|nr:MAG: hypothetical protein C4563_06625 [Desulfobulbus sp.]
MHPCLFWQRDNVRCETGLLKKYDGQEIAAALLSIDKRLSTKVKKSRPVFYSRFVARSNTHF